QHSAAACFLLLAWPHMAMALRLANILLGQTAVSQCGGTVQRPTQGLRPTGKDKRSLRIVKLLALREVDNICFCYSKLRTQLF
ncbi:MAG: hypothetical protein KDE58_00020, partial [Caldilineaceae bacterium]|nr:hypothetical protein [Caldilineaceae bacterium]